MLEVYAKVDIDYIVSSRWRLARYLLLEKVLISFLVETWTQPLDKGRNPLGELVGNPGFHQFPTSSPSGLRPGEGCWQSEATLSLWIKQIGCVDRNLEEERIVDEVRTIGRLQFGMLNEHRAPRCHIHRIRWSLEARTGRIGSERVRQVLAGSPLVEQGKGDSLTERPS